MSRVLVIGDPHCGATHPRYLDFCCDIRDSWQCGEVVIIGDIIDHHNVSFHGRDPEAIGPLDEFVTVKAELDLWKKKFPKAKVCIGNHDERIYRLASSVNIISKYIRPYSEVWDTPEWEWDYEFIIDNVHYSHGTGCSGINPAFNAATKRMMSTVIGHCHSRAGIKWAAGPNTRIFGMDVGCGVDHKAIAMRYGRNMLAKPILACGVVIDGIPYHEIMPCGHGETYCK